MGFGRSEMDFDKCCHSGTKYIGHLVSFTVLNLEDSRRHVY